MGKPDLLLIGPVTERMMARLTAEFEVHVLFDQADHEHWLRENGDAKL